MKSARMRSEGFALLAALWLVVLVAGSAASVLSSLKIVRYRALNLLSHSEARAEARAGVAHAATLLRNDLGSGADHDSPEAALDRLRRLQSDLAALGPIRGPGGGTYALLLSDESALLPINAASEAELQRFLRGLGVSPLRTAVAAASLADWIDADDLHRANGAEWDDHYSKVPGAEPPSNAPFTTRGEMRRVRGMEADVFDLVRMHVTVSSEARVNINSAHPAVLAALPGLDGKAARLIDARRRRGPALESLEDVALILEPEDRAAMQSRYTELNQRVTFRPGLIRVESVGRPVGLGHPVRLEATLAVIGDRVSVVRVTEVR